MTTWEHASSKLGNISDKARSIAKEIFDAAQAEGHDVWFMWGDGNEKDHVYNKQGRPVLDFMVRNTAAGNWIYQYAWDHRARLGLKHGIFNRYIISTVVQPGVMRGMANRGNPTANHEDHFHGEWFAEPAYTPPPTGTPGQGGGTTAPPAGDILRRGSKGDEVLRLQNFFHNNFPGYARWSPVRRGAPIDRDGDFGPQTEAWVKLFQERTRLDKDGQVGPLTRAQLVAHGYR